MSSVPVASKLAVDGTTFETEVVELSNRVPVVVDFWASWCGPCRQLGPLLEQEVERTGGAAVLRTVDVDANPELAQRFAVRGIPAVKAFKDGRVIGEFVGALPGSQVRAFVTGLLPSRADELVEQGDEASLREALDLDPSHLGARRALTRLLLSEGSWRAAAEVAGQAPQDRVCDGLAAWADLAEEVDAADGGAGGGLQLLDALRSQRIEDALEVVLALVPSSSGAGRDRLRRLALYCFEELGSEHPMVAAGRSRLAAALY